MHTSRCIIVALTASLLGCAGRRHVDQARTACPAPPLRTGGWVSISDSLGIAFRLPPNYHERPTGTASREWVLDGDDQQYIILGYIASSSPPASLGRAVSPGMLEMTQCIDSVGTRELLVQAWRTRGGTFRNGQRLDRYDVFAVVPVRADLRLYLMSGSYKRGTQDIALAAVRTIAVGLKSTAPR